MLNSFFAAIYENLVFRADYFEIFFCLNNMGSYTKFGLIFLLIPIVFWFIFYYLWNYPYGRWWHWLIFLLVVTATVFGLTWSIANIEVLSKAPMLCQNVSVSFSEIPGSYEYAQELYLSYSSWNCLLSLIVSFLCSLGFKQISTYQKHLPF